MRDERADEQWMRAYAANDRRALGVLFDRYAHRFVGLYRHCLQDEAAAEALLEATFAEMHRIKGSYRATTAVRPWLFGLAARMCLDAMGKPGDGRARLGAAAHSGKDRVDGDVVVRSALGELDGSARIVFYLHRYEGMSFGEIAEVLGSSAQAVRMQAVQTYRSLHGRLRPWASRGGMP